MTDMPLQADILKVISSWLYGMFCK